MERRGSLLPRPGIPRPSIRRVVYHRSVSDNPPQCLTTPERPTAVRNHSSPGWGEGIPRSDGETPSPATPQRKRSLKFRLPRPRNDSAASSQAPSSPSPLIHAHLPSSRSLTSLQLLRSYGYISTGMIRDESVPFEVMLAGGDHSPPTNSPWLQDELPPFDMQSKASKDSLYTVFHHPIPISPRIMIEDMSDDSTVTESESESELSSLSFDWPMPPKRNVIVVGNTAEVWIQPEVEVRFS